MLGVHSPVATTLSELVSQSGMPATEYCTLSKNSFWVFDKSVVLALSTQMPKLSYVFANAPAIVVLGIVSTFAPFVIVPEIVPDPLLFVVGVQVNEKLRLALFHVLSGASIRVPLLAPTPNRNRHRPEPGVPGAWIRRTSR